jgi:GH24 family phage-related lysozyme (muramidase)/uncharacterized protein YycO
MDNRFQAGMKEHPALMNRFSNASVLNALGKPQSRGWIPTQAGLASPAWVQTMSASNRVLVILIENGGVDLGIPALVDKLISLIPGGSNIPDGYRRKFVDFLREKIEGLTDSLIESTELSINRYTAAKPDYFGDVVVLRDGTASYEDLKNQLFSLSRNGRIIDLLILTHGADDYISVTGSITGKRIRDMRAEFGRPLSIRSVYMMNCVGSTLNQDWLAAGAKVSSGAIRNNYLPEPTTHFFWQAWKSGKSFGVSVSSAYQKTIDLMDNLVRGFVSSLPTPLDQLAPLVNFASMDFVNDSSPVVQGDAGVTIASDDLTFTQNLARQSALAMTTLPVGALRLIASAQSDAQAPRVANTVSPRGIEFIRSRTTFHANTYDDLGHCAIGYGTPLHHGRCDGRAEERRYAAGISEDLAMQMLTARVRHCEDLLNDAVRVSLNQNQMDALASFVFSLGNKRFRESMLLRLLNAGNYTAVPAELRKWTKARRDAALVDLPALVERRAAEAELFRKPETSSGQSLIAAGVPRRGFAGTASTDIPLDPGTGGRSIEQAALNCGDLIVSTGPGAISKAIRAATNSPVSHAMLYIGGGQVVEAIGEGVTLRSIEDALADATVAVAFRDPELTPGKALMVRDFAGRQLGKPYNYIGVVRRGGFQLDRGTLCSGKSGADYDQCVNWVGNINLGKGNDDSFFCSQLVVAAFENAGVPLTSTPPNWTSPADLAELGMARRLGYVGHLKAPPISAQSQSIATCLTLVVPAARPRTVVTQSLVTPFSFAATEWESLISFRPPASIQAAVKGKGANWHVHRLEDAYGDINLDYYPVSVSRLPAIGGRTVSAGELLSYIRLNINSFVDSRMAEFSPYDSGEAKVWSSSAPLGSVVHIDMKAFGGWLNPDDGSVVVSESAPDHWIFSTIWTVMDMAHPVSGNRQFGYAAEQSGGYVFYTRGADRTTGLLDLAAMSVVYSSAHNLWLSFQSRLEAFINGNSGSASAGSATSIRTPWPEIQATSHHPSVGWI